MESIQVQLETKSIKNVPLNSYEEFDFIVNGKLYKTSRLISDLISNQISHMHKCDPTIKEISITTKEKGDFSFFLNLTNFDLNLIPETEVGFISEVIEKLDSKYISVIDSNTNENKKITNENIFTLILKHENFKTVYYKQIEAEIEYISSHLFELLEKSELNFLKLKLETIEKILNNRKIRIKNEDRLLTFVNHLYSKDSKYSILYDFIYFRKVSSKGMNDFLNTFDVNDITNASWISLSDRLGHEIKENEEEPKFNEERYIESIQQEKGISIKYDSNDPQKGIIDYFKKKHQNNIKNKIKITSTSIGHGSIEYLFNYEDGSDYLRTNSTNNNWICFEFCENKIIPSHYTIKSANREKNREHLKSWVIEISNDSKKWEIIDEQKEYTKLNGPNLVQTFQINKNIESKYIRIRNTSKNWNNDNDLMIGAFEIYGILI